MDQTFSKKEKLKSKKLIDLLFEQGQSVKAYPLRLVYIQTALPYPDVPIQIGFSVPKRLHKLAVTRNRLKRLQREAYRLNKERLYTKGTTFAVLVIYTSKELLTLREIEPAMVKLFKKFREATDATS